MRHHIESWQREHIIEKLSWIREELTKWSESSWFWKVPVVFGVKKDDQSHTLTYQDDTFNKLVTFSFQKVQNCFGNHINIFPSNGSLVSFPFTHVGTKKNEWRKKKEGRIISGGSMAETLGHCHEWASEGLDADIATGPSQSPSDSHYKGSGYFLERNQNCGVWFEVQTAGSQRPPPKESLFSSRERKWVSIC